MGLLVGESDGLPVGVITGTAVSMRVGNEEGKCDTGTVVVGPDVSIGVSTTEGL